MLPVARRQEATTLLLLDHNQDSEPLTRELWEKSVTFFFFVFVFIVCLLSLQSIFVLFCLILKV